MALLTSLTLAATYIMASVMAYEFFEILIEGHNADSHPDDKLDLEHPTVRRTLFIQALIWPYYVIKSRFLGV